MFCMFNKGDELWAWEEEWPSYLFSEPCQTTAISQGALATGIVVMIARNPPFTRR